MITLFIIIIVLLSIAIAAIAVTFLLYVRKSTFIPNKDKEFIEFTIDMYVQYAKDLDIHSPQQHKKIIIELERIKNKYFKTNGK